eukprot:CAMPEP_0202904200 /NCGR_PEP_ID=MMETSP1392-20130828/28300_1 /ASSEMBLY_ACC=CAM_ASM_000868 /TAXON_ID=225041 /ORGANISM="Chlamydomonas chlamydogama, Strain SAG 11-48b" /LENGTH=60 /DNA_ID=CAMNT_0049591723 /DNA_START=69 /DNA_END=251 /DNA_ORIENTATION=-
MSVISGSSVNSNVQPQLHVMREGKRNSEDDDEDDDIEDQQQASLITGMFGVVYTVSRVRL